MRIPRRLTASIAALAATLALLLVPGALLGLAAPRGPEIRIATAGTAAAPSTAVFPDGGFVVAWTTGAATSAIHARFFAASGAPASGEIRLVPPQPVLQQLDGVAITADGGFAIVWEQTLRKDPDHFSVLARKFDRRGNPRTAAFQVHDVSSYSRSSGVIAGTADGGFVVGWAADSLLHTDAIARFFHSDGTAAGPALSLTGGGENDPLAGDAILPAAMAAAPDGSVVIVSNCLCAQLGLVLQRFSRDGGVSLLDPIPGDELDLYPSLSMAPDGSFVVVWVTNFGLTTPNPADSPTSAVRARRFAADGTALGDLLRVNQQGRLTALPLVASLADGSFVVAWTDETGRDGSHSGVFARAYDAGGNTSGPDLQLDQRARGNQFLTSIAAAGGRAVAAWQGQSPPIAARLLTPH